MGVYNPIMKMPTHCYVCSYATLAPTGVVNEKGLTNISLACGADRKNVFPVIIDNACPRDQRCPLIEINDEVFAIKFTKDAKKGE